MKRPFVHNITASLVLLVVIVSAGITMRIAHAATGQIYITPGTASVQSGDQITVTVRINPGTTVDGVQGTVTYDPNKLEYVSFSVASSAFSAKLQQTQTSGNVAFARGELSGGVSGDSLVETITFKALVGSGSSTLGISGANATSGGAYTNPTAAGATISFTTPAPPATMPTPPATGTGTGSGTGTSTTPSTKPSGTGSSTTTKPSTTTTTPTNTTTPATPTTQVVPVRLDGVDIGYGQAVFHLTTTTPTKVYIKYGPSNSQLVLQTVPGDFSLEHIVSLDSANLTPGETYSYTVVTVNQSGQTTEGTPASIKLKGLSLKIAIFDGNHHPLVHQKVELHSTPQTATTDDKGYASFSDVTPGQHRVIYTIGKQQYTQTINAVNNITTADGIQTAPIQNFSVVYSQVKPHSLTWLFIVLPVLALALGGAAFVLLRRRNTPNFAIAQPSYEQTEDIVQPSFVTPQIPPTPTEQTPLVQPPASVTPTTPPATPYNDQENDQNQGNDGGLPKA